MLKIQTISCLAIIGKLSICTRDGFCDGKTSNVASSPWQLSSPLCIVELGGLADDKSDTQCSILGGFPCTNACRICSVHVKFLPVHVIFLWNLAHFQEKSPVVHATQNVKIEQCWHIHIWKEWNQHSNHPTINHCANHRLSINTDCK